MKFNVRYLLAALLSLGLLVALTGCSTTVEAQQQRFASNADSMELLATQQPMRKADILKKLADYKAEQTKIMAGAGDQKKELSALNRRVEKYLDALDPSRKAPKTTGTKLGTSTGTQVAPPGSKVAPAAPGAKPMGASGIIKPGSAKPVGTPMGAPGAKPMGAPGKLGVAPGAKPMGATPGKLGTAPAAPGKLGAPKAMPAGKMAMPPPAKMPPPPPGLKPLGKPAAAPAGKLGAPTAPKKALGTPSSQPR